MASIDVVVPVGPRHWQFVPRLLKNLSQSEFAIGNVILAPSGTGRFPPCVARGLHQSVTILPTLASASASTNRNRGWDSATADFVAFCDADDYYHRERLGHALRVARETSASVVIHNYWKLRPRRVLSPRISEFAIVTPSEIRQLNPTRNLSDIRLEQGGANIHVSDPPQRSWRVHHGHPIIRTDVKVRYREFPYGEDGFLLQECLEAGISMAYTSARLSLYEPLAVKSASSWIMATARHQGARALRRA